jgi:hypothetical protein
VEMVDDAAAAVVKNSNGRGESCERKPWKVRPGQVTMTPHAFFGRGVCYLNDSINFSMCASVPIGSM